MRNIALYSVCLIKKGENVKPEYKDVQMLTVIRKLDELNIYWNDLNNI